MPSEDRKTGCLGNQYGGAMSGKDLEERKGRLRWQGGCGVGEEGQQEASNEPGRGTGKRKSGFPQSTGAA